MLNRRSKVVVSSLKELEAAAFTVVNYQGTPNSLLSVTTNLTLTSDTKQGVLGGSIAAMKGNYLVGQCTPLLVPCGFFVSDAIPDNFVNAPAVASNKIGVTKFGGEFEIDIFETHSCYTPFASQLAAYTVGTSLYCSPFGLLTTQLPSTVHLNYGTTGASGAQNIAVAAVTWQPTTTNLILGVDALV